MPIQPPDFGEAPRRTQEFLSESEERFRLLVEGIGDYAIFMLDLDGYVSTWNLGAQRMKGYDAEEIIGEHFSIFYTDEDVERGHPEEELRVAVAEGRYEEEGIRVRKDGSTFWANVLITALRDEEGNLRGFAKVTRNITERKEAEERERLLVREQSARERVTDILESISDAFFAVDHEWHFTYINSKAEELWGRSREELLEKDLWEEFPRAEGSESYWQLKRAMEEGLTTEFETVSPVLGTWIAGRAYPSRDGLSVYFQDVTERRRAEEEIRRSEERYRSFVEQSTEGIWRFELEEPIPTDVPEEEQIERFYRHAYLAECNNVVARMYGFTHAEEIVGARLGDFLPRSVPENVEYLRSFVRSDHRLTDAESEEVDREGNSKRFLNNLTGVVENGFLVRAWGTQRDVTEHKEAERRLQEAETRYRTLVEQIPAITYVQEPVESSNPKAITYMSPQYETILGYPPELEVIDEEHWLRILYPEDRERVLAEEARTDETGEPFKMEYRVIAKDGRVVWLRDEATLVRDEEGKPLYWLGVQYDITEQKRAEQALREVREGERLRMARDLHDGVLQDLSYTTAAMGLIMLNAEGTGLEQELKKVIEAQRRAAEGLRAAVNDLRLEEERNRPFSKVVEALVERNRAMARSQEIGLEVEEGFPATSFGDAGTEILRVIQEALTNARRHSGALNVIVTLKVEEDMVAEVLDDGRGLGPGAAPGVGLKSMRERAAALGGKLEIESAVGEGTTVRLRAPMSRKG